MPNLPQTEMELKALRADTVDILHTAHARTNQAAEKAAQDLLNEIDDALDDLAMSQYSALASKLSAIKTQLDAASSSARAWPFGSADAPENHERSFREIVTDNDFQDQGPQAPPPAPTQIPMGAVPTPSLAWTETYKSFWTSMIIQPDWQAAGTAVAKKIILHQARYASAVAGTSIPWWFVAVVHAMECSLNFNEHLHNGDPLTAQTTRIPKGRPPFRVPPPAFTWEESAADAMTYDRIDKISEWSIDSALYNWHRFNGINNEYKRRGIPTPYLWSGTQLYRKGKYVADGVFDSNAVSGQVGAAVILRTLINLGAVFADDFLIASNPAVATGHVASLSINASGPTFKHVAQELDFPGELSIGYGRNAAEKRAVTRVQEWLNIHSFVTPIDGKFGDSTTSQLKSFQASHRRPTSDALNEETWALLTSPMRRALASIDMTSSPALEDALVRVASQHIAQSPTEVGGNNCGPWVRLYMQGKEGADQKWCAGFVCFSVAQAGRDLGISPPFDRQVSVNELVADAKRETRFIPEGALSSPAKLRSTLRPGNVFVVRTGANDWVHTGIVLALNDTTFDTLEGNTGGEGGIDGPNAKKGNRSYSKKDFLTLT